MKKRFIAAVMALVVSLILFGGCSAQVKSTNLTDGIERDAIAVRPYFTEEQSQAVNGFAAKLLQQSFEDNKNTVISPISVLYALAMTANGADGETLSQMEALFGMDIDTLNEYLYSGVNTLPSDVGYDVDLANSIWVTDDEGKFKVKAEFLQQVKNYYDAGVFIADFDDNQTLKDINNWVTQKTNGKIQDILDKIDEDAVMYLVNAINFEADWQNEYKEHSVRDNTFIKADGTTQNVEFMYSGEYTYLEDENTTGFLKYYKDRKYAFVALLPDEDISLNEYVASLDGKKIDSLLKNTSEEKVNTSMPKFETTFDTEMSESLKALGMTDAFDYRVADFSRMGQAQIENENLCVNRVIHKAFIRVAEKGTQAGAATVVEMVTEGAAEFVEQPKEVHLNRPFVYMIIDTHNNLPLFMGAVTEIE